MMGLRAVLSPRPGRRSAAVFGPGLLLLLCLFVLFYYGRSGLGNADVVAAAHRRRPVFENLHLDEAQCQAAFSGLTKDIDDMVAQGPFPVKQARDAGPLQVRLKGGELYIVHKESDDTLAKEFLNARIAVLHQIHRAVLTSPGPLPDTILSINVLDGPANDTWSYSRPAFASSAPGNPPITRAFLMPHFAFWAWPLPFVGGFDRATAAINAVEAALLFTKKDPRPVWRGTKRYNSAQYPQMRTRLLETAGSAAWADVQELTWASPDDNSSHGTAGVPGKRRTAAPTATNALMIEDFCRYKYLVHTEGITYSGRFQFLQMCESVVLTPPIAWLQHTTHLVRPLFTSDVPGIRSAGKASWQPSAAEQRAWPRRSSPADANIVFVAPDWSDLKATVDWLESHPNVARGIARRQRQLFVGGGYFSPAAEACYWRGMIRGWSKVAQMEGQDWEQQKGVPWEIFSLGPR